MASEKRQNKRSMEEYTAIHAASALEDMLKRATLVKTFIGDYDYTTKGGSMDLIVVGHRIDSLKEYCKLMTKIGNPIRHSRKLLEFNCNGQALTPVALLKRYIEVIEIKDTDYAESLVNAARMIVSDKAMNVPFEPGTFMAVDVKLSEPEYARKDRLKMVVQFIEWRANKETGIIENWIHFSEENKTGLKVKYKIEDYGKEFGPDGVLNLISSGTVNKSMVEMAESGWIKPLEITDGKTCIALDNKFIYRIERANIMIIGVWENDSIEFLAGSEHLMDSEPIKAIKKSMMLLKEHRKMMSPYKLTECNKITL